MAAQRRRTPFPFLTLVALSLAATSGCTSQRAIEAARARGAKAGREDGRRAGESDGFTTAFAAARKQAYRDRVNHIYSSGEYHRVPFHSLVVVLTFFILGFGVQWIVLYVPRRVGFLPDIDWIVLPKPLTAVDFADLSSPASHKRRRVAQTLLLFLATLPMVGCKSEEQKAWEAGYDRNYSAGYHKGREEGAVRGKKEGAENGTIAAQDAAESGRAWGLYSTLGYRAMAVGIFFGVIAQYITLLYCRLFGRLSELLTVVFVPAVRSSLSYSIFEKNREIFIRWEQQNRQLAASKKLKLDQMQAVHDLETRKLKTISSIEDSSHARRLELAREKLSSIVASSEQRARPTGPLRFSHSCFCPHCGKRIAYTENFAGRTVNCPHKKCGEPIKLPGIHRPDIWPLKPTGVVVMGEESSEKANEIDWSRVESRMRSKQGDSSASEQGPYKLVSVETDPLDVTVPPTLTVPLPDTDTSRGILVQWKKNQIDRKTALRAVQAQYDAQLDALGYHLRKAVSVSNARADVLANQFLEKLNIEHAQIMKVLGLRSAETRMSALIEVREMMAQKMKEVQAKKWPQALIDETIDDLIDLGKRVSAELLRELGT